MQDHMGLKISNSETDENLGLLVTSAYKATSMFFSRRRSSRASKPPSFLFFKGIQPVKTVVLSGWPTPWTYHHLDVN